MNLSIWSNENLISSFPAIYPEVFAIKEVIHIEFFFASFLSLS